MHEELASDYAHKHDLLRAYVLELLHLGQKQQPATTLHPAHSAAARLSSRFVELLERQFPLTTPQQRVPLRTAKDFADHLAVHFNHLNKVLQNSTGRTTTDLTGDWCRKPRCSSNNMTGRSGRLPIAWASWI
jgi:AraC family transcriptional activator of pobA